ncbi:hypothetical protein GGH93_002271, partial [Coemansia aciculifera]
MVTNYCPICIGSILRKVAEKCMLDPITQKMRILDRNQGFRSPRSTVDAVAALHTAVSSCPWGSRVILTWDIKGAYDRVPRNKLCETTSRTNSMAAYTY